VNLCAFVSKLKNMLWDTTYSNMSQELVFYRMGTQRKVSFVLYILKHVHTHTYMGLLNYNHSFLNELSSFLILIKCSHQSHTYIHTYIAFGISLLSCDESYYTNHANLFYSSIILSDQQFRVCTLNVLNVSFFMVTFL